MLDTSIIPLCDRLLFNLLNSLNLYHRTHGRVSNYVPPPSPYSRRKRPSGGEPAAGVTKGTGGQANYREKFQYCTFFRKKAYSRFNRYLHHLPMWLSLFFLTYSHLFPERNRQTNTLDKMLICSPRFLPFREAKQPQNGTLPYSYLCGFSFFLFSSANNHAFYLSESPSFRCVSCRTHSRARGGLGSLPFAVITMAITNGNVG